MLAGSGEPTRAIASTGSWRELLPEPAKTSFLQVTFNHKLSRSLYFFFNLLKKDFIFLSHFYTQ